jgi:organic hydroperoxide reductase OsmC/OhrA
LSSPSSPVSAGHAHAYAASLRWSGSTAGGYEAYDRAHQVSARPAVATLSLSGDPAFLGDAARLNPEQLLLMAASSCQCLSFLAVAARARIDVISYADEASAVMPSDDGWITEITLRPRIGVRTGPSEDRIRHLVDVGHRECFIARSVRSSIVIEASIDWMPAPPSPS